MRLKKRNKYGNEACLSVDGKHFPSRRERDRYHELLFLQKAGKISDLRTQVPYELIPSIKEEIPTGKIYVRGQKKGQPKMKTVTVEQPLTYIADFVYIENGKIVVEDAKGKRTPEYIIKRKLMLWIHHIRIRET